MPRAEAEDLLAAADAARRRTRARLQQYWLPLVLFGGLTLASAVVARLAPGPAVGVLWLVGAPAATLATTLWYWRRHDAAGVSRRPWPYLAVGLALAIIAWTLGWAGRGGPLATGGVLLAIGLAYAAFALLERSRLLAAFAAFTVVLAAALAAVQPAHPFEIAMGLAGATAIALGGVQAARS